VPQAHNIGAEKDKIMKIINLTPHAFTLCNDTGEIIRIIEPTKPTARVSSVVRIVGEIDDIPITKITFGAVEDLPEPQEGTIYIVSLLVQQAVNRPDVYRPDTGPQSIIRDSIGQIVGVKALAAS